MRGLLGSLPDLEKGLSRIHCRRIKPPELLRLLNAFQRVAGDFTLHEASGFKSQTLRDAISAFSNIRTTVTQLLKILDFRAAREGVKADLFDSEQYPDLQDAKDVVAMAELELKTELKEVRKVIKKPAAEYLHVSGEEYLIEVRISESSKLVPSNWWDFFLGFSLEISVSLA